VAVTGRPDRARAAGSNRDRRGPRVRRSGTGRSTVTSSHHATKVDATRRATDGHGNVPAVGIRAVFMPGTIVQ
jgi:hypothetical protein